MEKLKRLAFFDSLEVFADQSAERIPPQEILLVKYGKNDFTKDGQRGEFEFTEKDADAVIAEFATRGRDGVIDYEHQTLSGNKAPAAGWISKLEKTSDGLKAQVKYWLDEASGYLKAGAYRYFSPVLQFSRSGKSVSSLHSVALTNHPALHGIPALVADDAAGEEGSGHIEIINLNEGIKMENILNLLGLVSFTDKTDEEKEQAVAARISELVSAEENAKAFLKLHDCETLDKVTGKIQAMVPAEEKSRLEGEIVRRDAESAVAVAMSDGKVSEAFRPWALDFAKRDLAGFCEWSKAAPKLVPDGAGTDQKVQDAPAPVQFSDNEKKIFRNLGFSEEDINKLKKE